MTVKLNELLNDEAVATAKLGSLEIEFTYKPNAVTAEMALDDTDKTNLVNILADVLVDWSVIKKQSGDFPPTVDNLMKSPIRLLTAISAKIAAGDDEGEATGSFAAT